MQQPKPIGEKSLASSKGLTFIAPKPFDFDAWIKSMEDDPFSDEFCNAVEEQVNHRCGTSRVVGARDIDR